MSSLIQAGIKVTNTISPTLRAMAQTLTRDVLAKPMEKVAALLCDRMRDMAPTGATGNLKRSISFKVLLYENKNMVVGIVGPRRRAPGRPTRYAHLVEFGHMKATPRLGRDGKTKMVRGGYVPAEPFMRPAVEIARQTIAEVLGDEIANMLDIQARAKLGNKVVNIQV